MRKIFRKIHLWLSIPFGLIITVICLSGAALVFEGEVMELCRRDLYYVKKVEAAPLPADQLLMAVAGALPDSVTIAGVTISSDPERAYQVNLSKPRRASIYVDQYTGEIKGRNERAAFFTFMFKMHRWLLDSVKQGGSISVGKLVVGVSTLMFVFVLISGICVWWPRTRKALKKSLKIATGKGWKRFWYDLHVAGGMYTLVFLLAMALTGLTWSFQWYRTGFYKVFGVEMQQGTAHVSAPQTAKGEGKPENKDGGQRNGSRPHGREGQRNPYAHWQQVYDQLKQNNPGYKQITVSKGSANVTFNRLGNQRAADRYTFNPRNGEITETVLYKDTERSGKIRGWIFSVHVGSFGGMFTRILAFLVALLGGTLPLTGYYLWIRRLYRKRGKVGA